MSGEIIKCIIERLKADRTIIVTDVTNAELRINLMLKGMFEDEDIKREQDAIDYLNHDLKKIESEIEFLKGLLV
jgi:predicted RNA methylase